MAEPQGPAGCQILGAAGGSGRHADRRSPVRPAPRRSRHLRRVEGIIRRWEDEHEREIPTEQRGKLAATIYEALDETDNPLSRRQVESMLEFAGNNARRR